MAASIAQFWRAAALFLLFLELLCVSSHVNAIEESQQQPSSALYGGTVRELLVAPEFLGDGWRCEDDLVIEDVENPPTPPDSAVPSVDTAFFNRAIGGVALAMN